ncbi:MAG: DPP IV N-terminal domain-containing protein [Chloroflexota bacterium]
MNRNYSTWIQLLILGIILSACKPSPVPILPTHPPAPSRPAATASFTPRPSATQPPTRTASATPSPTLPAPTIEKPTTGEDWLLFTSSQDGYPVIYAARIDGSNTIKLMDDLSGIYHAALSPDGAKIAFSANSPADGSTDIYTMNVDGSNLVNLTAGRQDEEFDPAWSPDGKRLAFISGGDIFIIDVGDGSLIQLTNHPRRDSQPSWSPDGTRIAFRSDERGKHPDIYLINSDGANLERLTDDPGAVYDPNWSPDGSRIIYGSAPPDKYGEIHVINADGTGKINLSQEPYMDGNPRWSPDGTQILFNSGRDGQYRNYLMNLDGSGLRPLPEPLASATIMDWRYSAALSNLASTLIPPTATPIPTPKLSSEQEKTLALQTLLEFFERLHDGEYEQASDLYGGSYAMLIEWNPGLPPKDHPMLLKNGCEENGLNCLRVHDVVFQEETDQLEFLFLVSFEYDDGTIFETYLQCCTNATEGPPVWQFPYTVKWVNGRLLVMGLPKYAG